MTFFVDANVVVYAATEGPYHDSCVDILGAIAVGEADGRTSTAVLEEVWHVELSGRAGDLSGLAENAYTIFTPLLTVDDEVVGSALGLSTVTLGANDRIHVATCALHEIDTIVSADTDFDRVRGLRRVDPLDRRALARALGT
ncbi:MAG: type II toxin-antitoxin system VapC family toxin [Gaiellaceae bacterium]